MRKETKFIAHSAYGKSPTGLLRFAVLLTLIVFVSCSAKQPIVRTPVELPKTFSDSGEAILPDKWWLSFNDPALNKLIEEALAGNLDFLTV